MFVAIAACATSVSGQQPKPEPYVAPLLPAQPAWTVTFAAPPAAGGAMDDRHVYVPLQNVTTRVNGEAAVRRETATVTTLDRETGAVRWIRRIETAVPPVAAGDLLYVAGGDHLHALSTAHGRPQWQLPLGSRVRAPMILRGNLLLALTEPDQLIAIRTDRREIVWRSRIGEAGPVLMNADDRAVYLSTADSRIVAVRLDDGSMLWEQTLEGTLSEPAVGEDRVFVGSTTDSFWALDPDSGSVEWVWNRRIFGGDVIGAAVEDDVVYVASLDNIIRALNRGNGNQRWKTDIGTRPVLPPRVMFGTVVVVGLAPTVNTFLAKTGANVSSWSAPADAELQGPPLIDRHLKPYRVAMVVIMRDGRVTALRPTAMMFAEPAAVPLPTLPGRGLPLERLPTGVAPSDPPRFRPFLPQPLPEPATELPGRPLPRER